MPQQRPSKADIAFSPIVSQESIDAASAREKSGVSRLVARVVAWLESAVAFKSGGLVSKDTMDAMLRKAGTPVKLTKAEAEKRAWARFNQKKGN